MNEILNQLKHYFDNTPREEIEREWNALGKEFGDVGPKVEDFLVQLDENFDWEFEILKNEQIKETTPGYYNSEFFLHLQIISNNNIHYEKCFIFID